MLHGRERELELRQLLDEAEGFRVLRGRGFESEAEIPYAGLLALARPLLVAVDHAQLGVRSRTRLARLFGDDALRPAA